MLGPERASIDRSLVMLPDRYQNHCSPSVFIPSTLQVFIPAPGPAALMVTTELPDVRTTCEKLWGTRVDRVTATTQTESQRTGHRQILLGSFITADPFRVG